jgi:hypothetical protein
MARRQEFDRDSATAAATRLLDRDGAAEYLQVSTRSIDRLIDSGQLRPVRLPVTRDPHSNRGRVGQSRRIHIDRRDLDALIDSSK